MRKTKRQKLTSQTVATLPVGDHYDDVVAGLELRVTAAGVRTWAIRYRSRTRGGGRPRYKIGPLSIFTLASARAAAKRLLSEVALGADPAARLEEERAAARASAGRMTVEQLLDLSLDKAGLAGKSLREFARINKREIVPALGRKTPAEDVDPDTIKRLLRKVHRRGAVTMSNRVFDVLRRAYRLALRNGEIAVDPTVNIDRLHKEEPSDRVLSTVELRALLAALDALKGPYSDAVLLLLLTGTRLRMVLGMRQREIEDVNGQNPRWAVGVGYSGRSKGRKAHVVPLSPRALAVVRRRFETSGDYLFPGRRRGAMVWQSKYVTALQKQMVELLEEVRAPAPEPWTIHGLRSAMATHMAEDLAVPPHVISLILGHAARQGQARITRVYDRSELLGERRAALCRWADWLDKIVADKEQASGNVVPFRR